MQLLQLFKNLKARVYAHLLSTYSFVGALRELLMEYLCNWTHYAMIVFRKTTNRFVSEPNSYQKTELTYYIFFRVNLTILPHNTA